MSAFGNYFDKIYVINLLERKDRQAEMSAQLERIGLSFAHSSVSLFPAIKPMDKGEFATTGARGCFLSHLAVLEDAIQSSFARIAIFEDDLNFTQDFELRIDHVLRGLMHTPWSLFYGGHRVDAASPQPDSYGLWPIPYHVAVATTHFVAFQGAAITQVASMLALFAGRRAGDPQGGPMHVDGAYNWYRRLHPSELALAAVPELGYQRSSRTDVHPLGWADKAPVIRDTIARLRRFKNRVVPR